MLQLNQLQAIKKNVNVGAMLPNDLASALLAAFEEAENNRKNNLANLEIETQRVNKLMLEDAETQALKKQLETEIDKRVMLQTRNLEAKLSEQKYRADNIENSFNQLQKSAANRVELGKNREQNLMQAYCMVREQLIKAMPESWIKRFRWRAMARGVIREAQELANQAKEPDGTAGH